VVIEVIVSSPAPQPSPEVEAVAVDEVEEEFLALVCADEELLRAEFDAIIAEGWGRPAPPSPPRRTRPPAQPPRRRGPTGSAGGLRGPQRDPGGEGRSRQRAPPQHDPHLTTPNVSRKRAGRW
jgi:hypothetical protein